MTKRNNNSEVSCLGLTFKIILIILATKEAFYLGVLLLLYILQQELNLWGSNGLGGMVKEAHIGTIGKLEGQAEELQKLEDIILSIMDMTTAIYVTPYKNFLIEEYNFGFRILLEESDVTLPRRVYTSLASAKKAIDTGYAGL